MSKSTREHVGRTLRVTSSSALVALALVAFAPASLAEAPPADAARSVATAGTVKMTLTGTIEAAEKNIIGQTTQVRIVSSDQGAFLIATVGKGEDLTDHVGQTVTLTARRVHDDEGNEVLSVEHYQVHEG